MKYALPLLCLLMFAALSLPVWAEDSAGNDTTLDTVVVTAERDAQDLSDTARAVSVVTEKEMWEKMTRTVPESLRQVAGVSVQRTNLGGGAPFIRGLVGNQVLYLVDGIRVNNSTVRGGPNQYLNTLDPFFIERIEVVRGPSSVLYGTDALGGTINIITKRRGDFGELVDVDGRAFARATSAEKEQTVGLYSEGNLKKYYGYTLGGSIRSFGDIDPGGSAPIQEPYGYENQNLSGNFDIHFTDKITWQWSIQHVNFDEVPNYDPTNIKNWFEPQRRNMIYTRLIVDDLARGLENLTFFASYHQQIEGRQKISADEPDLETRDLDVIDTVGTGLQFKSEIAWAALIYGGEFYHDMIASERTVHERFGSGETDVTSAYPDESTYTSAAGYLELRLTPWDWVKLVPGVRYSYFAPDAEIDDPSLGAVTIDDEITDLTWAAHVLFKPHPVHGIILGASRGFRAPSLEELTRLGSEDGRYDVPNPDLEPEKMIQYEAGYRLSHPRISAQAFGYYSDITDLVARRPATYNGQTQIGEDVVHRNENVGEAYIYGAEAQIDGVIVPDYFRMGAVGHYTFGENETDEEPIRRIPPLTGSAYARASWPAQHVWFEVAGDFADKQDRLSSGDKSDSRIGPEGTDGFGVMHLRSGYYVGDYIEIELAVENVFDEPYKYHGSGPLEAGRNFKGQLAFTF